MQTVLGLPLFTMIRDAALTGLGAARWPNLVVADDLAAGRLVSWGPATVQSAELWVLHTSRRVRFLQNCDAIWFINFNLSVGVRTPTRSGCLDRQALRAV